MFFTILHSVRACLLIAFIPALFQYICRSKEWTLEAVSGPALLCPVHEAQVSNYKTEIVLFLCVNFLKATLRNLKDTARRLCALN